MCRSFCVLLVGAVYPPDKQQSWPGEGVLSYFRKYTRSKTGFTDNRYEHPSVLCIVDQKSRMGGIQGPCFTEC